MRLRAAVPVLLGGCLLFAAATVTQLAQAQPAGVTAAPSAPATPRLPALGEAGSDALGLSEERRIGEQMMRELRRDPAYLDDPQLLDHLQSIWQPLLKAARARGDIDRGLEQLLALEVFLVRDRSINAFALLGGYVGAHLGLLAMTTTPDELASVMAHELSHVTQRHIARSIASSQRSSTLSLAATLLAVLAASRAGNIDLAQAALMGGQAAAIQAQLNFSRDMEREADRTGLALMLDAGFAAQGMARMFERMDQSQRLNDSGNYPYLRSHPLTTDRIGEARQRIAASPSGDAPLAEAPLAHALMRARARVLAETTAQAWQRLQQQSVVATQAGTTSAERAMALYTAALASLQLQDAAEAGRQAQALLQLLGSEAAAGAAASGAVDAAAWRTARRLWSEVLVSQGRADEALAQLALGGPDASRSGVLLRAQAGIAHSQPGAWAEASDGLQVWLADHRQDAQAWSLLARVAGQQGLALRALRAEAESHAARGDLSGAIERLRAGQQRSRASGTTDFVELSVIDARLRELLAERRSLQQAQARDGTQSSER